MVAAPRASWTGARGGTGLARVLQRSRSRPRSPSRSSAHARRRSPRRPAGRQCSRRGLRRLRRSASSRTIGTAFYAFRSFRSRRHPSHTRAEPRGTARLTSVGTPDPKALGTRFDGATSISASPAVHLLRAETEHAAVRLLAGQLLTIGPKRNSEALGRGVRSVAQGATRPRLPPRWATASEQK